MLLVTWDDVHLWLTGLMASSWRDDAGVCTVGSLIPSIQH